MEQRGKIRNRKYSTQVNDFSKMRWKNITPTDIDGLIDFGNKLFVLFELKYDNHEVPYGQRLAIERIVDNLKKPAIGIIASHKDEGDVQVHDTSVVEFRYNRKWHKGKGKLKPFIDLLLKRYTNEQI